MTNKTQIFCFHRISDEISPAYPPIPVNVFDKICKFLSKKYLVIPLHEVGNTFKSKKPRAVITFDDAYYDFYEEAMPVLQKYRLPATQHVITSCAENGKSFWTQRLNKIVEAYWIEKRTLINEMSGVSWSMKSVNQVEKVALQLYKFLLNRIDKETILNRLESKVQETVQYTPMMSWDQIKEVFNCGISVGSHTHTHTNLLHLSDDELNFELNKPKELITQHIGDIHALSLAFPNGKYDSRVVNEAKRFGYQQLLSTEPGSVNAENEVVLPRFSLYSTVWWKNHIKLLKYCSFD